jgi:stage II sporulation protein D
MFPGPLMRRPLAFLAALMVVVGLTGAAEARRSAPAAPSATFVVAGHGWGHGVGMSQYGAYGYAQHGFTYPKILAHYFPGTQLGPAPVAKVRVLVAAGKKTLKLTSPVAFTARDAGGDVHDLAAGSYTLTPALKLKVDGAAKAKPITPPLLFQPGGAPLQLGSRYRGSIQVDIANGALRAVNIVGLEQYLYGVVPSEMPFDWAPEALKAQAVVARSYALATKRAGAFDLYPDTRSQVYLGYDHEKPSSNAAVDATAGKVLLYNGQVAKTYFFSTSGGRTASAQDVWGTPIPYLVSVPDPYDTISPYHKWGPIAFSGARLGKALHVGGPVLDVHTTLNSSGRVTTLTALTQNGERPIAGNVLRRLLGLRSTWLTVGVLSLSGPGTPVAYGSSAKLSGVARGMSGVVLQQQVSGAWQPVGAVKPASDGSLAVAVAPKVTTEYRLAASKVTAGAARVPVMPVVRLIPPRAPTELRGRVRPILTGTVVTIQRQQGTTWARVAHATVDTAGVFAAQLQLTTGTYRARVPAGHGLVAGVSAVLQVSAP